MNNESTWDVAIIGGGPAGATAATYCARSGFRTCLIEKKAFPREMVCGEFLSREVTEILADLGLRERFYSLKPEPITDFRFCPEGSQTFVSDLPFTAYGLKRGIFDAFLLDAARESGVSILQPGTVKNVTSLGEQQEIVVETLAGGERILARHVIGGYGKSGSLNAGIRRVPAGRSGLNGIKFHVPRELFRAGMDHEIRLYTGDRMYCGINAVDHATATICFLERRSGTDSPPRERLVELLHANRHFAEDVSPEFIAIIGDLPIYGAGDIDFGKKGLVQEGMFMVGDAARVIAPLAGDGIGMAMESARLLAGLLRDGRTRGLVPSEVRRLYVRQWKRTFSRRIAVAGILQRLLLSPRGLQFGTLLAHCIPSILSFMVSSTRGKGREIREDSVSASV